MKTQAGLSNIQIICCYKTLYRLSTALLLMVLLLGCGSRQFKPMTVGFQECELIFSVHGRCKGIPEDLKHTLSFRADHAGVSFARDNVTLTQDDFTETDTKGCLHSQEIRIPYQVKPSLERDFTWQIMKGEHAWLEFKVAKHACKDKTGA